MLTVEVLPFCRHLSKVDTIESLILVINLLGDAIKSIIKLIFVWIITLCRIVVGLVVIKTGVDFTRGSGAFAYRETDAITGIFVIIIGTYFVFSSLFFKKRK